MERFKITLKHKKETLNLEVADYLHHEDDHCKFEVFFGGKFAVSFEPNRHKHLQICKNAGLLKDDVLDALADKLEALPRPTV